MTRHEMRVSALENAVRVVGNPNHLHLAEQFYTFLTSDMDRVAPIPPTENEKVKATDGKADESKPRRPAR